MGTGGVCLSLSALVSQAVRDPVLAITCALVLAVVLVNGWTDAPNAIAAAVGAGALSFRRAALLAAACNLLGAVVMTAVNASVAETLYDIADFGSSPGVLDLCSEDLVSYTISNRPVLGMVISMLEKAFETIPEGTGLILHSDQGWQYQHKQYQRMLESKGIRQSMSRKGNCLDNAVMENFFGLLKSELLYLQNFDSLEHFKTELIDYLDYYNNRRIKLKLKGLTPAQHRYQTLQVA